MRAEDVIAAVVAFAQADHDIRAVILEGSRGASADAGPLSDFDLNVYTDNPGKYLRHDEWLNRFGDVLVEEKQQFAFYGHTIPTRLVLLRTRTRMDFSFWPPRVLDEIVQGLKTHESYRNGFRVLIDKDGVAARLPKPDGRGFSIRPPAGDEFRQTIFDMWFQCCSVATQLARGNLFWAKFLENRDLKEFFVRMALWRRRPAVLNPWKRFESWGGDLIDAVVPTFSPYDRQATWKGLFAMFHAFNRLAREVANELNIDYPEEREGEIASYLESLKPAS